MPKLANRHTTTKFSGEYISKLLEYGKEGKSKGMFCRDIGICEKTFQNWCENYPQFKAAWTLAKYYAEAWWYEQGRLNLVNLTGTKDESGTRFNTELYKYMTGGRFGWMSGRVKNKKGLAEGDAVQRNQALQEAFAANELSPQHAMTVAKLITDQVNIQSQIEMLQKIEQLEIKMEEMRNRPLLNSQYSPEPEYENPDDNIEVK